jgi:hypothetical protein
MHLPDGTKQYVGLLEWYDGEVWISVFSEGMLMKGEVSKFEFARAYCQTEYGIARYEQSPFMFNIALYGTIWYFNDDYLAEDLIEVPAKWGFFEIKDLLLDYFDNYIALGITPMFKKYNASDFKNYTEEHENMTVLASAGLSSGLLTE